MNNKKTVIIVGCILAAVLIGAYVLYGVLSTRVNNDNLAVQDGQAGGTTAGGEEQEKLSVPDFTVYDRDGKAFKLSDFKGKPVILNFWASWCGPCKSEMPDFNKAYEKYGESIHFLMVNTTDGVQETLREATAFVEDSGYTFPVYYDTDVDAVQKYYVYSIPTTYFIDAEGYFVTQGQGALDAETLQKGIDMLL